MSNKKHILYSLALLGIIVSSFDRCDINYFTESLKLLAGQPEQAEQDITVNGADIFAHFTGMTEAEFKKATNVTVDYIPSTNSYRSAIKLGKKGPFSIDNNGDFILKNVKTGEVYNAGQFATHTHEKLIDETDGYSAKKPGTFSVITSPDFDTVFSPYVDTIDLQYQAAVNGEKAVFLVASDYDGIEATSGNSYQSIQAYLGDQTQGPAASLGCFPGALLRLYSQIRENKMVATKDFDPDNPRVHMLKAAFLDTQNGYVYLNKSFPFNGDIESFLKNNGYSFSIMYHKNQSVPVKQAKRKHGFEPFIVPEKIPTNTIDQIFTAGLSLGIYQTGFVNGQHVQTGFIELLAKKILFDIYDSAIRAAIKNGRDTVYLLPIGCGVFGNKKIWAGRALEQCKELIVQSGLTVKYIISGLGKKDFETQQEFDGFIDILKKLAQETGGSYIDLSLDKNGQVVKNARGEVKSLGSHQRVTSLDKLADMIKSHTSKMFSEKITQSEQLKTLETLITENIKTELSKNPKALEIEDSFGLTPAHRMLFELFLLIRGEYWGSMIPAKEAELLDHAFAFALNKLRTNKQVLGKELADSQGYLTALGITKTPMSVGEFLNKIFEITPPSGWKKVRALKLT